MVREKLTFAQVLSSGKLALLVLQVEKKLINVVRVSLSLWIQLLSRIYWLQYSTRVIQVCGIFWFAVDRVSSFLSVMQRVSALGSCLERETAERHRTTVCWSVWKRISYNIALKDKNIYYKGSLKRQQFPVSGGKRFRCGRNACFFLCHQPVLWPWPGYLYVCFMLVFVCLVKLDCMLLKAGPVCSSVVVKSPALVVPDLG